MPSNTYEYMHDYYMKNKEHFKELMSKKVICHVCEREISKPKLNRHLKTNRCKNSKVV